MNGARLLLSLSAIGVSLLGACSSSDSSGGASDGQAFISSLASIVCDAYAPCCAKKGLPTDGAQCRAFYAAFGGGLAQGSYDAAAGQACLDATRAAVAKATDACDTSSSSSETDAICNKVFKTDSTATKNPGEACNNDSDCIASAEGSVECYSSFTGSAETKTCLLKIVGKAGDGPCVGTIDGDSTTSSFSDKVPAKGYTCNKKDNLHCGSTSQKCDLYAEVGEKCTFSGDCVASAYCNVMGACADRVAVGGDCTSSSEACSTDSHCDTTSKKCVARVADGTACASSSECLSGSSCVNMKCSPQGDFGSALLCGGS